MYDMKVVRVRFGQINAGKVRQGKTPRDRQTARSDVFLANVDTKDKRQKTKDKSPKQTNLRLETLETCVQV